MARRGSKPAAGPRVKTLGLFKGRLQIRGDIAEVSFADLWEVK
jgi:hypothetical protein